MAFIPTPDGRIYVVEIKDTKDTESKQVQLRQYTERSPEENVTGYFMKGHSKFTSQVNKKAVFISISNENIKNWGLEEGVDFQKAVENGRFKNARLQVRETLTPRVYKVDGKITFQSPKTAGTGGDVLTIKGKPIYHNTVLSLKGEPDELIKHDGTVTPQMIGDKFVYQVDEREAEKAIRAQIKRKGSGFTEADLAVFVEPEMANANADDFEPKLEEAGK